MSFTVRETCRLCDAPLGYDRVLDLGETPLANGLVTEHRNGPGVAWIEGPTYPLYLKQCTKCGHVQLPVVVDPRLLFPADYPYASATGKAMREHLTLMARDLDDMGYDRGAELVAEIGSNDGYLLGEFRRRGYRVVGIDPALTLATSATERGDLTLPAFFNRATAHAVRNACGPADLIVANNVFAHADDLHEIVEGVKVLLAPEGRFVFEVGHLQDVLRTNNFPTIYHEHLSYHTILPLRSFFTRHGLVLWNAERIETQGGSMRCTVVREGVKGPMPEWPPPFLEMGDMIGRWLATWQSRVETSAQELAQHLCTVRGSGKTIAGYGCSAKSTTLLHAVARYMTLKYVRPPFNMRDVISFICDDAPTKQGKYSPGFHIPIVPGAWLEEKQPDYCVSLSGNFSEAFKAEHPGFKGEWIEPNLSGEAGAG